MYRTNRKWLRSPIERVGTLSHSDLPPPDGTRTDEDHLLTRALQERDGSAFESLLDRYSRPMLRVARTYVRSTEEAEDVVQDTWVAVLTGVRRFEGRSSLRTWIFRILVNRARTRAKREARLLPFSSLHAGAADGIGDGDAPYEDRLVRSDAPGTLPWPGSPWEAPSPIDAVLASELRVRIDRAIRDLPPRQREVVTLRDVDGWTSEEVCARMGISEANQRVLLHRARTKVRRRLEGYVTPQATWSPAEPAGPPGGSDPVMPSRSGSVTTERTS